MAIKNMVARIPRAGKVKLGGKKGVNSPGRNLNHFRIETTQFEDFFIKERLGENPSELRIKFPRTNREDEQKSQDFIFDASYKAYKGGKLFCKGDGETAMRAIAKGNLEQVSCTCEYLTGKNPICKQRGELRVILCDLPFLGYFEIGTSSWNSINSIQSVIETYKEVLGDKFWITEFILFKEETMMQGHKQYIMRMRVASDFVKMMPTGSEVNAVMMFEEEEEHQEQPADELPPEPASETAVTETAPAPEPEAQPEPQSVEETPSVANTQTQDEAEYFSSDDELPPVGDELPPEPKSSSPAPAPEPSPAPAPAEPTPPPVEEAPPVQETPKAAASEPEKRNITPQRRMKEQRVINALNNYKKEGKFDADTVDTLCIALGKDSGKYPAKPIAELSEAELAPALAVALDAYERAKKGAITAQDLLTDEDIPF